MTHKVVAVVKGTCPHCITFLEKREHLATDTKLKMLVCDVNAQNTDGPCVDAMRGVTAFPTFKCVSQKTSIEGFGDIKTVEQFVNECP